MVLIMLITVGCIDKDEKINEYFKMKEDFNLFIVRVYGARNEADIINGKQAIKEYLTEQLYEEIKVDLGEFKEVDSTISNLSVAYINKENSTNNRHDKLNITFRVISGDRSKMMAIEFIKDESGLFSRYNVFEGIVEQQ